ncbi:MAG: hypothetical protein JNM22_03480 [Saprospiraceae bacterium]|nr:hypothetical protein [Saprospiraceae bacterium]
MSNTNGNNYPAWGIDFENRVFAMDTSYAVYPMSDPDFAELIAISDSGIIWVLSTSPDQPTGSVLYWGKGDGNWTPVGNVPGAVDLTGGAGTGAVYATEDGQIWSIDINGEGEKIDQINDLQDMDFGGGYLWAVFPLAPGGAPVLQFAYTGNIPVKWQPFNGAVAPDSISAGYTGDCYGVSDFTGVYYSTNGTSTGPVGSGANGSTLEITFKNNIYALSTNGNEQGNDVLIWVDTQGGVFEPTGVQAIQILATYYL